MSALLESESWPPRSPRALLGLGVLLLAALLGWDRYAHHEATASAARKLLANQTEIIARNLAGELQATANGLDVILEDLSWLLAQPDGRKRLNRRLRAMAAAMHGVHTLVVVDAGGDVLASSLHPHQLSGMSFRERDLTLHQGRDPALLYVSGPFVTPSGLRVMALGKSRLDDRGQFDGHVLAILDPDHFRLLLTPVLDAPDVRAELIHGDGQPVFSLPEPAGETFSNPSAPPDPEIRDYLASNERSSRLTATSTAGGAPRLLALRAIWPLSSRADKPLVVRISRDRSAIFAPWRRESLIGGGLLLVIALLATLGLLSHERRQRADARLAAARDAERALAEIALRESEERLRRLGDNLPDSALYQYIRASDGSVRFLYVSVGIERLNGVRVADVLDDAGTLHRQIPPEHLQALVAAEARSAHELSDFDLETPMCRPDGETRWMRLRSRPRRLADGRTLWDGVQTDITEQRKAAQALERALQALAEAQRMAHLGSFDYDLRTQQALWSDEEYRIYGLDPGEISPGYDIILRSIHPDDRDRVEHSYRTAQQAGSFYETEHRIIRPDGAIRWIWDRAEPYLDENGALVRYRGTTLDITERKAAEQCLAATNLRLQVLLDALPVGVAFTEGLDPGRILANATLRRLYELPPAGEISASAADTAAPGRGVRYFHAGRELSADELPVQRVIAHGQPIPPMEVEIELTSGRRWIAEAAAMPLRDAEGQLIGAVAVAVDITARKRLELEWRRYQQIVETATEMLVFVDPELRYALVNPAYAAFHHATPEALQGRRIADTESPAIYAQIRSHLEASLAGEGRRFTIRGIDAAGQERWIEAEQRPFVDRGAVAGIVVSLHDITEARRAQIALEAERASLEVRVAQRTADLERSEARLRTIFDVLPIGLSIIDTSGRIVDCNRAAEQLVGVKREEQLQRTHDDSGWRLLRPDGSPMPPEEYASVRALRENRLVRDVEMGVDRPEGITWISVSAMPAPHPDYGVVIAFVDITERRRAEDQRRLFQAIVEASEEAIAISDPSGQLIYINPAHARLFGRSLEQAIGVNYRDYYPPESLEILNREVAPALKHGDSWEGELDVLDIQGRRFPLWERAGSLLDAQGQQRYGFGFMHDITERKRRDAELRQLNERLQHVIDGTRVGTWEWQIQTGELAINQRWAEIVGYRLEELEPISIQTWLDLAHPEDLKAANERLQTHFAGRAPYYEMEARMRHKDGRWVWVADRGRVATWTPDGRPERMSGTHQDITALKQAQEAAEQAAQAKSDFLAHMSHEIRTPMNGILGLVEVMLHQALGPEMREDLTQIHRSAGALVGILNDILDDSRIDAGRLSLECGLFDLEAMLATLRGLFTQTAIGKGLDLRIAAEPAVPHNLLGDSLRLQQVLSNLIGNAIKFTERGEVRVRVGCEAVHGSRVQLRWTVTDTGIGMDAPTLARLFQPFTQGDASIARRFGGTGLGLSISRRLAELMGGSLTVESRLGAGTTFTLKVELGVAAASAEAAESAEEAALSFPGARILVAEDHPLNQRVITAMLRLLGAEVTLASDGREALERLAAAPFDAVLMDIQMPEMDGLTATQRLREQHPWAALPVIALTAGVTAAERERMRVCGLNDLLPKPVTLEGVREVLGRWLPKAASRGGALGAPPASGEPETGLTLPGFDLRRLRQIAEDEADLHALLRQFADSIRADVETIAAALDAGDSSTAGQSAHRIKGVAATLGAVAVCNAAARLEEALRSDPGRVAESLAWLRTTHAQALEQIAQLPVSAAAEPGSAEGDPEASARLLAEIRTLVAQQLYVSPGVRRMLGAALPASARTSYESLVACLDRLDYAGAERQLAALAEADASSVAPSS